MWGLSRRCRAVTVPAVRPPAATPWAPGAATARRRARLLVSGAAAAAVATAVLLALLTAALVTGWGGGSAAGYGSAAFGAAGLAVGLHVLARAVAVTRTDPARGRALCIRCCVWALFAVLAVFIVGGVAGYLTRAATAIGGARWPVPCSLPWSSAPGSARRHLRSACRAEARR